jgi:hypothetical protein
MNVTDTPGCFPTTTAGSVSMSQTYRTPTAGQPLHVLIKNLERAGWGDLAGADLRGVRTVLGALCRMLPNGAGTVTVEQIATTASYSTRWTRHCLTILEDLEIIEWKRGGIVEGNPSPSFMRIDKRAVAALVILARDLRDTALEQLRQLTRARIAGLRALNIRTRHRKRRSLHMAARSDLPPTGEVPGPDAGPLDDSPPPTDYSSSYRAGLAAARAAIRPLGGPLPV